MIHLEAWYREALEKDILKQFKGLPEDQIEKMEQVLRIYMRTKRLPPEVSMEDALKFLTTILFPNITGSDIASRVEPEYFVVFWEIMWDFLGNNGDLNRVLLGRSGLHPALLYTPRRYRPKIPVEVSFYERDIDYTSLTLSYEGYPSTEVSSRYEWYPSTEISSRYWSTPWVFVSKATKYIPLLTIVNSFPSMGRNPDDSGNTPHIYYVEKPSWMREIEVARELVQKGLPPIVHQTKVEFDLSRLPGSWPGTILRWRQLR